MIYHGQSLQTKDPYTRQCSHRIFLGGCAPLRNSVTDWWRKQILKVNMKKRASYQGGVHPLHPLTSLPGTLYTMVCIDDKKQWVTFWFHFCTQYTIMKSRIWCNSTLRKRLAYMLDQITKVTVTSWSDLGNCDNKRVLVIKCIVKNVLLSFKFLCHRRQFLRANWDCKVGKNKHLSSTIRLCPTGTNTFKQSLTCPDLMKICQIKWFLSNFVLWHWHKENRGLLKI